MKYGNETCEKKILSEVGMGKINIRTNNAKGNRTNTKDEKYFLKTVTEAFIPSSLFIRFDQ